jgi:hypothetical protein
LDELWESICTTDYFEVMWLVSKGKWRGEATDRLEPHWIARYAHLHWDYLADFDGVF